MKCPICKQSRNHKLHTDKCSQQARHLKIESFIGAYKTIDSRFLPLLHQTVKVRDYKMNQSVNLRSIQTQIKSRLFTI
jgi:hypothetical protein